MSNGDSMDPYAAVFDIPSGNAGDSAEYTRFDHPAWSNSNDLRPIEEIPHPYQQVFATYPNFNLIQSKVIDDVFYTDVSLVVAAPTGSGKTIIFELAIVKILIAAEKKLIPDSFKIIYICPMKALCEERLGDWHKKFSRFGLNCISVTGDSDNVEFSRILGHNLIITTPEKWDCLTRKWKDNIKLVQLIKLFMIDEVHLLNEDARGSVLETIVCRMKTIENSNVRSYKADNENSTTKIRFIAVSATIANIEDIAEWIGKCPNVRYHRFSDEYRPVKLQNLVFGYACNKPFFKFDMMLTYKLKSLIMQYSDGKPTLIFCSTRKIVEMTAKHLVQNMSVNLSSQQKKILEDVAATMSDFKVKECLVHGVGFHHAGLLHEHRRAVEKLFRENELPVLVTTSTLAVGVNLPAHLVIVKSTKTYSNEGFVDYSETALLQMIGRAGRPQFDTSATAIILTTDKDQPKFERMVVGNEPIESNLHKHLTEHLNAEVVLRTITDLDVAMQWLSSTFLYIRAKKNPQHYGLRGLQKNSMQIDRKLLEMCQIELDKLVKAKMLTMDENVSLKSTDKGVLMAKYYLAFETMKLFTEMTGHEVLQQILALISKCAEFSEMYLRVNDKKCLNLLNKCRDGETIRFPLNGRIKTVDMKINCIIQAVLGCLDIGDNSIMAETLKIMRNAERITKCLIEYLQNEENCFQALLNTIILSKCFEAKLWENSLHVCKQLVGIGKVMSSQLVKANKTSFEKVLKCDPREIELILNKKAPMGNKVLDQVQYLPRYSLRIEKGDDDLFSFVLHLENAEDLQQKSTANVNSLMHFLVGNSSNKVLLYEKYAHAYMCQNPDVVKIIEVKEKPDLEFIEAHFISEDWVGFDCVAKHWFKNTDNKSHSQVNKKAESTNKVDKNIDYMQNFMQMYLKTTKKKATGNNEKAVVKDTAQTKPNKAAEENSKNDELTTDSGKQDKYHMSDVESVFADDFPLEIIESENLTREGNKRHQETIKDYLKSTKKKKATGNKEKAVVKDTAQTKPNKAAEENSNNDELTTDSGKQGKYHVSDVESAFADDFPLEIIESENLTQEGNKRHQETIKDLNKVLTKYTPNIRKNINSHHLTPEKPPKEQQAKKDKIDEKQQLKITWRSPLTYSPPVKYSPKVAIKSVSASTITSASQPGTKRDQNFKDLLQMCKNSFTSTIKPVQSIKRPQSLSKPSLFIPLSDDDYERAVLAESQNKAIDDIAKVASVENFGLIPQQKPMMSPKFDPRDNNELVSRGNNNNETATSGYYAWLMSQPLQDITNGFASKSSSEKGSKWHRFENTVQPVTRRFNGQPERENDGTCLSLQEEDGRVLSHQQQFNSQPVSSRCPRYLEQEHLPKFNCQRDVIRFREQDGRNLGRSQPVSSDDPAPHYEESYIRQFNRGFPRRVRRNQDFEHEPPRILNRSQRNEEYTREKNFDDGSDMYFPQRRNEEYSRFRLPRVRSQKRSSEDSQLFYQDRRRQIEDNEEAFVNTDFFSGQMRKEFLSPPPKKRSYCYPDQGPIRTEFLSQPQVSGSYAPREFLNTQKTSYGYADQDQTTLTSQTQKNYGYDDHNQIRNEFLPPQVRYPDPEPSRLKARKNYGYADQEFLAPQQKRSFNDDGINLNLSRISSGSFHDPLPRHDSRDSWMRDMVEDIEKDPFMTQDDKESPLDMSRDDIDNYYQAYRKIKENLPPVHDGRYPRSCDDRYTDLRSLSQPLDRLGFDADSLYNSATDKHYVMGKFLQHNQTKFV